jgi:hypothetical protein
VIPVGAVRWRLPQESPYKPSHSLVESHHQCQSIGKTSRVVEEESTLEMPSIVDSSFKTFGYHVWLDLRPVMVKLEMVINSCAHGGPSALSWETNAWQEILKLRPVGDLKASSRESQRPARRISLGPNYEIENNHVCRVHSHRLPLLRYYCGAVTPSTII